MAGVGGTVVRKHGVVWGAVFAALVQGCADRGVGDGVVETSADGGTTGEPSPSSTGDGPMSSGPVDSDTSLDTSLDTALDTACDLVTFTQPIEVDASSVDGYAPGETLPLEVCLALCDQGVIYESLECALAVADGGTAGEGSTTDTPADGASSSDSGTGGESTAGGSDTATGGGPSVTLECTYTGLSCDSAGRRSAGLLAPQPATGHGALGRYFAAMAHNEAASVASFVRLEAELADHGAPAELLARVRAAARDEVRHARVMRRLARAHGVEPVRPRHVEVGLRPLAEIARENAIEGCVTETWSALLCTWQARHSVDPEIAAALRQIAADETRHADLAWALAVWMAGRLDAATNASIETDRFAAAAALMPSLEITMSAAARAALGLPSTATARVLASGLRAAMAA